MSENNPKNDIEQFAEAMEEFLKENLYTLKLIQRQGIVPIINRNVYERAISEFGEKPQIDMAIEEMAELTKALLKHRRRMFSNPIADNENELTNNIAEEMADVYITMEQLKILFDNDLLVEQMIQKKTRRLNDYMDSLKEKAVTEFREAYKGV